MSTHHPSHIPVRRIPVENLTPESAITRDISVRVNELLPDDELCVVHIWSLIILIPLTLCATNT